jgi:hypothetical protein
MNLNALIVTINSRAWYWRIRRNLKNGFVPDAAVTKPKLFINMTMYIRWKIIMAQAAHVVEA